MQNRNRGLRIIGALTVGLIMGTAGSAAAAASSTADTANTTPTTPALPTPDLSFAAFGTGTSADAARAAAVTAALGQQNSFTTATGAACSGPLSVTTQSFQLSPSGYGAEVTLGFGCGAPTHAGSLSVSFSGFGTGSAFPDTAGSALSAAYKNEAAYAAATGVKCVDSPQPDQAQVWQVVGGEVAIAKDADSCQAP